MALKRREFLERAGWALAGLGLGLDLWNCAETGSLKALSVTSKRKLALLVGINQYGDGSLSLPGCLTDVELQRELLLYRFGFQSADILTLTDSQATAANIRGAFIDHLIEQARPGDAVVFHFSGYGRRVLKAGEDVVKSQSSVLVAADGVMNSGATGAVNDLSMEDLVLLLRSLAAENVLAVLDTSYVYPGSSLQGSLRVRSLPAVPVLKMEEQEPEWIEPLKDKLAIQKDLYSNKYILMGAGAEQVAGEMQGHGFSAGVFTYALTQTLWQARPASTLTLILNQAACTVEKLTGIDVSPHLENVALKKEGGAVLTSFLGLDSPSGDGVCTGWDGESKTAQLWLGGLSARVLDCYGVNSVLQAVGSDGVSMVVRSRSGLMATAQVLAGEGEVSTGQIVRELVRVLPRNVNLTVALDSSLERIERVDATSAFAGVPNVSPVGAGSVAADCLFGRLGETLIAQIGTAALPAAKTSYGLFSLAQNIIVNTVGEGGEAVKSAVRRLAPHLHTLLAAKLWRLTANESSSRLACRAALELVEESESRVLLTRGTFSGGDSGVLKEKEALVLPAGSRIQYRLYNESSENIYYVLVGMDNRGRAFASGVYDPADGDAGVVRPGESVTIPSASLGGPFLVRGVGGLAEAHLVCCQEPLIKTVAGLASAMSTKGDGQQLSVLASPLPVAMALLQDLHDNSVAGVGEMGILNDGFVLDMRVWATLSFVYRVV